MNIGKLIKEAPLPFFSLEFFPPAKTEQLPDFYATVAQLARFRPLFASVTYGAGGSSQDKTLNVTGDLAQMGLTVMAHLTCVGAQPHGIRAFINELLARGVDNVLALRGDPPKDAPWDWSAGYFRNAADLVRFIRLEYPALGIGVAAYPAPHPESATFAEDRRHTAAKLASGADFAITQLFFDVREYVDLRANLRAADIDLPVIPGILVIQSMESLKRVLSLCGANIPAKFYLKLEAANEKGGAEAVREEGLAFAIGQARQLLDRGAPGIHLYTLNRMEQCARIITECGLA